MGGRCVSDVGQMASGKVKKEWRVLNACGLTFGDVHGVSGKAGALPDETAFFGEERGDFAAHELVGDGFVGVGV